MIQCEQLRYRYPKGVSLAFPDWTLQDGGQAVLVGPGKHFVVVDDFIGQGGTITNLRGHIERQGSRVVGTTVLTGKPFSAKLALSAASLQKLREQHGTLENWWIERFGFGFDCLSESEARYLIRSKDADTIRDRIIAQAQT